MLEKNLIAKTAPKVNEKNVVLWKNYRLSVLSEKLFRLERSENNKFRDEATLAVWYRNMPPQKFATEETDGALTVKTAAVTLILRENRADCRIVIGENGAEQAIENADNLKGTYRTLDGCDGDKMLFWSDAEHNGTGRRVDLSTGVCSRSGVAVYDDSKNESLLENGEIAKIYADGTDEYIFAFGNDYRGAVKALCEICGNVPMIPRFALGNWWSRYREYTDEEYLTVLERFAEREIPLSVATVDMDWHYSVHVDKQKKITESGKNTPFYGGNSGWTGYSWNPDLFPDYKAFLKEVRSRGLKITLNLHPADGIRWFEDMYEEAAKALGRDASTGEKIAFDIFDPDFANVYFSVVHHPYEDDGVDFWWIDWQQGTAAGKLNIDPLWALNHYHYLDNARKGQPLILSRYAGVGSHRYPLGFSGDSSISWDTLDYLPYFTATASNVAYGWWSHDIGGHHMGTHDGELYLRHVQYGVFSPINRYHCTAWSTLTKEPWAYLNGTGALAAEQMRLRHKLLPFLYTCAYRSHLFSEMITEPLYYYHPETEEAYSFDREYYFGKSLLVAPVTAPASQDGFSRVKVWLPQGVWTDIFTGDRYVVDNEKGAVKTLLRSLESIPVLAKAGTILPFSEDKGNGTPNPENLTVRVFNGNGAFEMYEDGTESGKAGEFFTVFETTERVESDGKNTQILKISARGNEEVIPKNRRLRVRFENIEKGEICLRVDGQAVKTKKEYTDQATVCFDFECNKTYEVSVTYTPLSKIAEWKKRAERILRETNGVNQANFDCFKGIRSLQDFDKAELVLGGSTVTTTVKERLRETLEI